MVLGALCIFLPGPYAGVAERRRSVLEYDWATTMFLAGVFVMVGMLGKHGCHVSLREFVKIGLPFTVIATVLGFLFIYFVWR